jgi:hypothetical protein
MIVRSDEIVSEWIKWATHNSQRKMLTDLWLLSDFIGGRNVSEFKIKEILDKMDQGKNDVKTMRRELKI